MKELEKLETQLTKLQADLIALKDELTNHVNIMSKLKQKRPSIEDYSAAMTWEHDDKDYERYADDLDNYIDLIEVLFNPSQDSNDENKTDLQFLSEWIDLKTSKADETATMIIEKITEMMKNKNNQEPAQLGIGAFRKSACDEIFEQVSKTD
jgi:predicted  nucleic acid-binding Zn-ribbon protein